MRWLKYCRVAEKLAFRLSLRKGERLGTSQLDIGSFDFVSRHIFAPSMGKTLPESELNWGNVFQFSTKHDALESLVWRKFAPDADCVDSLGRISVQQALRLGRTKSYLGSRSALVGDIRAYRNKNGHGIKVFHAPSEGIHHAHITYDRNPASDLTKNDKSELKFQLKRIFTLDR